MQKELYRVIQDIRERQQKGEPTTFKERNIVNIYQNRMAKKRKKELQLTANLIKYRLDKLSDHAEHNNI